MYSIRWRFVIIYLILVGIVFGLVSVALSSMVEGYLVQQYLNNAQKNANSTAVQIAPYLSDSDASSMYNIVVGNGSDMGGRLLILNSSGIVQTDSFSSLNGVKLDLREINDILYGQNSTSYAFHEITDDTGRGSFWSVYCTSAIIHDGSIIGVVLYSSSIQDVVAATNKLQTQTLWIFVLACGVIIISTMLSTRWITNPINRLTEVAVKISSGDLKQRAQIKGKGEIAELGQTFDMMCDKIQNLDKQRSEFVSDASHELKTPLASMKILVESLLYQDHVPEDVYKDFLSDINGEIDRLNSLITDLLLLSKMDSDIIAINLEKVNLCALIQKCVNALQPIAEARNITLFMDIDGELVIECDPLKLRQAINNLIENAIKYTQDGGHVRVSAKKYGSEVHVVIEDDGIGMSEEHLQHIFERFYRVDKARSRETGGTGLGLHIVRRIALMHGGRVDVESKENEGSKFTLILPLVQKREE
ncbi:MAG: HAMP domain-containing sensor histidine kinase [Christensenella sp.]|nr:HAMP domain-containing sensor histidine kinase [Christensenella sp.]